MSDLMKFWGCLAFMCCLSFFLVQWVYAFDMVIEDSIAHPAKIDPPDNINKLLREMGIDSKGLNPCYEIEELCNKYCTTTAIELLLYENNFEPVEDQLFREFLKGPAPCHQFSEYMGSACMLKNFKKIVKFFSLKK